MKKNIVKTLAVLPILGLAFSAQADYGSKTGTGYSSGTPPTSTTERGATGTTSGTSDSTMDSATGTTTRGAGTTSNPRSGTSDTNTGSTNLGTVSTSKSTTSVLDQSSGTPQDIEVTRKIRESLTDNDSLSTSAKNIEVITLNNTVTLRGSVASQTEKAQVASIAQSAAGSRSIRNEITVDTTRR